MVAKNDGTTRRYSPAESIDSWYVDPETQLRLMGDLNRTRAWGADLATAPAPPSFEPRTKSEVLMLSIVLQGDDREPPLQRTVEELWAAIALPPGSRKLVDEGLRTDPEYLRALDELRPGIRWVGFDPNAFHLCTVASAREASLRLGLKLAGVEVLTAAILFPRWLAQHPEFPLPYPKLGGLELLGGSRWMLSLHLAQREPKGIVRLGYGRIDNATTSVIPTVRPL